MYVSSSSKNNIGTAGMLDSVLDMLDDETSKDGPIEETITPFEDYPRENKDKELENAPEMTDSEPELDSDDDPDFFPSSNSSGTEMTDSESESVSDDDPGFSQSATSSRTEQTKKKVLTKKIQQDRSSKAPAQSVNKETAENNLRIGRNRWKYSTTSVPVRIQPKPLSLEELATVNAWISDQEGSSDNPDDPSDVLNAPKSRFTVYFEYVYI